MKDEDIKNAQLLIVNGTKFEQDIWGDVAYFNENEWKMAINSIKLSLESIYEFLDNLDDFEDVSDLYNLGDIINLLGCIDIKLSNP